MKSKQENQDLRDYAKAMGVAQWQIANHFGIHVMTLISRLRKPFNERERKAIVSIIDELCAKTGEELK